MMRFILTIIILMLLNGCITASKASFTPLESMAQVRSYLPEADLVVFDIDHTILEAKTVYCHSNWFYDLYEEALSQGISERRALDALVGPWEASQKDCQVQAVESLTPALIKEIQDSGKKVMALTSRSSKIARETIGQLASLGVDFSSSAPANQDFSLAMGHGVSSVDGVVFTSDYVTKGDVLKKYLKITNFTPKNIVFIDDSKTNLKSVSQVLGSNNLIIHALFYPLVKRSLPDWNKKLARLEWEKRHKKISY